MLRGLTLSICCFIIDQNVDLEENYEKRKCKSIVTYWGISGALLRIGNLVRICFGDSHGIL